MKSESVTILRHMNFLQVLLCLRVKLQTPCMIMSSNTKLISKCCYSITDFSFICAEAEQQFVMHMGEEGQKMEFQKWY